MAKAEIKVPKIRGGILPFFKCSTVKRILSKTPTIGEYVKKLKYREYSVSVQLKSLH